MRKLLLVLLILALFAGQAFAINDWIRGDGTDSVKGADSPSDNPANLTNYMQDPLDRLLSHYIYQCTLTRTSATIITVSAGEVVCSNGADTIKRFRKNTTTTTMTITTSGVGGLDSGSSEKVSTWYDIYAVADANATTFTVIAAEQGVALSDVTYYRYIGSVYNDSSSDLLNFTWSGYGNDPLIMWDVPILITTTLSSSWSSATSLASAMPSHSNRAIFGLYSAYTNNTAFMSIRPNGTTWSTQYDNSVAGVGGSYSASVGGQRECATDSSQQINYITQSSGSCRLSVEGFYINR